MKCDLELKGAWVTWARIGFGQTIYALYVPSYFAPVGLVWGEGRTTRFDVYGSFVIPWARRNGVRTRINEEIFKDYKVISTEGASKEGGRQFMKASGYKRNRELDLFYLRKK